MIVRINEVIKDQKSGKIGTENIYVADYKEENGGDVEISDVLPGIKHVHLANDKKIELYFSAFKDNALKVDTEEGQVKQCECVLFPTTLNPNDWVLFIETKYANNYLTAFDEKIDYPNTMIAQILSTINYFRTKGILANDRRVWAILSFPELIENFSESFFLRSIKTPEEILLEHKVVIRATNKGEIISPKRIRI